MSFKFGRDDASVGDGVRRIAAEQIEGALKEANDPTTAIGETVHRLRRRCKKLRGLLRLIRPVFDGYGVENQAFRGAAAGLSGTRDAAVMVETFDALAAADEARPRPSIPAGLHGAVRGALIERARGGVSGTEADAMLGQFREAMAGARRRVDDWGLRKDGFAALEKGLETTYRQLRNRMAAAAAAPTAEHLHEWRKTVKYHWHHVSLLREGAPDLLPGRRALLDALGEVLGDHHNLAVLGQVLAEHEPAFAGVGDLGPVLASVGARQDELAARAFSLGGQAAAEKPKALGKRFAQYWALQDRS